jgi:hypothetical protein
MCYQDSLTSLPTLPSSLLYFDCQWNNIKCFPYFPSSILVGYFQIQNNPFTCLPNYIAAMQNDTVTYPLCGVGNTNGCPVSYAGIEQVTGNNVQVNVYPNPTTGAFYISTSNRNDVNLNVEVQDLTGRIISKQAMPVNNGVVTLQNTLVNGVYMINITGSDGKTVTQKLVVNN